MADLKADLKAVTEKLADLKKQCLEKSATSKGEVAISPSGTPSKMTKARSLGGHFGKAMCVKFASRDGIMTSCGQDGLILLWDTWKGIRMTTPTTLPSQFSMMAAISPDAKLCCAGGLNNVVHMYKIESKNLSFIGDFEGHDGYVSCGEFDGESNLLTCSGDATLCYWDVTGKPTEPVFKLSEHSADCGGCDISGSSFVSCSNDATVKFWDKREKKSTGTVRFTEGDELSKVKFIPGQENTVAVSVAGEGAGKNHGKFMVVDVRAMAKLKSFNGFNAADEKEKAFECMSVAWSKSGRVLFGSTTDDVDPNNMLVFDINGGEAPIQKLKSGALRTNDVAVSADGCGLAGCNWNCGDIKSVKNIVIYA